MQVLPLGLGPERNRSGVQRFELDHFSFLLFGARVFDYRFFSSSFNRSFASFSITFSSSFFIFFLDFLYDVVNPLLQVVKARYYLFERLFNVRLVVFGVFGLFDDFFFDFFFKLFFDFFVFHNVLLFRPVFGHRV